MQVSPLQILNQGPVLGTLARIALDSLTNGSQGRKMPPIPGPEFRETIAPISNSLIDEYVRHVGGDLKAYKNTVPFHLFPQWTFPVISRTLAGVPYDLMSILNAGCRVQINSPLPRNKPLNLRAQLVEVDADERRVLFTARAVTETKEHPEALVVHITSIVKLKTASSNGSEKKPTRKKEIPMVPPLAREIGVMNLNASSGLEFSILTGDINPLHWFGPYARVFGHKNMILHGFSQLSRTVEMMNKNLFSGNPERLKEISVRFTSPLNLPARPGVFVETEQEQVYLGQVPGGPAYLTGEYKRK